MDKKQRQELEDKAREAIARSINNNNYKYQKRSWSWDEIKDGENYYMCRSNPFPWLPNIEKPSWFCRHLHWFWWCDDWERWQGTSFPYYYVLCRRCGRCWMEIRYLEWFIGK